VDSNINIVDKNGAALKPSDVVRYDRKRPGQDATKGWATIAFVQDKSLFVQLWSDARGSYVDAYPWDVRYDEGTNTIHASVLRESSSENDVDAAGVSYAYLEKDENSIAFDRPVDTWVAGLSAVVSGFVKEEGVAFAFKSTPLTVRGVSEEIGLLGAFAHMTDKKWKSLFSEEPPLYFYGNPSSVIGVGFDFDEKIAGQGGRNGFYTYAHLMLDQVISVVEAAKAEPEKMREGAIQLDDVVRSFLSDIKAKKVKVWPARQLNIEKSAGVLGLEKGVASGVGVPGKAAQRQ
jgi:hypothetical protein